MIPGFGGGLGGGSGRRSGRPYVEIPGFGDVLPVPGGGEAASLLGTSPEQRKRSIPSGAREPEDSAGLRFPPLWETSV